MLACDVHCVMAGSSPADPVDGSAAIDMAVDGRLPRTAVTMGFHKPSIALATMLRWISFEPP